MGEFKYKAFISYAHADRVWTRWLHRSLERYRVPKRLVGQESGSGPIPARLTPIFRDRDELATASDLGAVLEQALSESESLIVICSPASAGSRWVNEEIRFFRRQGRENRIFCLIVDGEPNASARPETADQECFPPMLNAPLDGGSAAVEMHRVAADVRPGGDGKQGAKLKIIAGMLGLGLDELRQREQQRRQKRLAAIAVAAVAGMAITTALATMALLARSEAERQRVRAEQEAETARQTSEFLIGLFNVVDPGEARGEEPLARDILDRGAARIVSQLGDQPGVRSRLQGTMGRVYTGLGLYEQAAGQLESALEAGQSAGDDTSETAVANFTALAEVRFRNSNYEAAERAARKAVELAEHHPGNTVALHDALVVLGNVLTEVEEDQQALTAFARALEIRPASSVALNGLGTLEFYAGRLAEARARFSEALAVQEDELGEDHPLTIETLNNLAAIAYMQKDYAGSIDRNQQALARARRIFGNDHPDTATYLNNLGRVMLEIGQVDEASALIADAVAIDRRRTSASHEYLVFSLNNHALAHALDGDFATAQGLYQEALSIARQYQHRMQGPILANLADLHCTNGTPEEGLLLVRSAVTLITENAYYGEDDWRLAHATSIEGACVGALGRGDAARPMLTTAAEKLREKGGDQWLFATLARERLARLDGD